MTPAEKSISFMKRLCKKYNTPEPVIEFTSKSVCSAGKRNGKSIYIVSVDRIQDETEYGFLEYERVKYLWSHLSLQEFKLFMFNTPNKYRLASNVTGDLAIHCLTLHEAAHIFHQCIDWELGDKPHGIEYQNWLKRLIRENPYVENFWVEHTTIRPAWEQFL